MSHPFSKYPTWNDGFVDEMHDAHWYCVTHEESKCISGNEPYFVLPVIGYIDKTGTDVNQRNKLEPFSFTFSILNQRCRYCSNVWRVLGFRPDLEHKSSAAITHGRSGPIGKGRMAHNYHQCLTVILQSLTNSQGKHTPIYGSVRIGNFVAHQQLFSPWHLSLVMDLVVTNYVDVTKIIHQILLEFLEHVMCLFRNVIILIGNVIF